MRKMIFLRFARKKLLVGEPRLYDYPRTALFAFQNSFVPRFKVDNEFFIRLDRVVKLQGEKVLRFGEGFNNQR